MSNDVPPLPPPKPDFDPIKASFYLIASILAFQCVIVFIGLMACVYSLDAIISGRWTCNELGNKLTELLNGALAAALAFSGGYWKGRDKS